MKRATGARCLLGIAIGGVVVWLALGADAPERRFTLVYNVNNGGYVDVCGCTHKQVRQGSLTRRASFLRQLRGTGRQLLLVDGGSALFPIEDRVKDEDVPEKVRQAALIVEAYNRMGYQAMAVGPFDLAAGLESLETLQKKAKFPFLSANLVSRDGDRPYFTPHAIVEKGGVRVGIIGLTQANMGEYFLEKVAPGAKVADPVAAARASLDAMKGKVDLVIALSHLAEEDNLRLIRELPEIEVLVDPSIQFKNHHTWIQADEWIALVGSTLRLRSDGQGARLGVIDIQPGSAPRASLLPRDRLDELRQIEANGTLTGAEKAEKDAFAGKALFNQWRISLEPHHGRDAETDQLIEAWKSGGDPAAVPSSAAPSAPKTDYAGVEVCKTCHEKQYQKWTETRHSEAMATLVSSGDQEAFDCIGCHSLGYGEAFLSPSDVGPFANVQCESCHGTNPNHPGDPEKHPFRPVSADTCIACHNKEVLGPEKEFAVGREKPKVQCPKG